MTIARHPDGARTWALFIDGEAVSAGHTCPQAAARMIPHFLPAEEVAVETSISTMEIFEDGNPFEGVESPKRT